MIRTLGDMRGGVKSITGNVDAVPAVTALTAASLPSNIPVTKLAALPASAIVKTDGAGALTASALTLAELPAEAFHTGSTIPVTRLTALPASAIAKTDGSGVLTASALTDVEPLDDYWDAFKSIDVKTYKRTDGTRRRVGVIADEIELNTHSLIQNAASVIPGETTFNGEALLDLKAVDYEQLYRMNMVVTQQLMARVEALEARQDSG